MMLARSNDREVNVNRTSIMGDYYIVYYHHECPFSAGAIRLLKRKLRNPDLQMLLIHVPSLGDSLQNVLCRRGVIYHNTFPAIFHNFKFIGGYSELKDLLNTS